MVCRRRPRVRRMLCRRLRILVRLVRKTCSREGCANIRAEQDKQARLLSSEAGHFSLVR